MVSIFMIKNGNIHDAIQEQPFVADILVVDGKIAEIGVDLAVEQYLQTAQAKMEVLDATGLEVYPGFVEAHCHIGLDGYGIGFEGEDFNEMGDPVTPDLSAVDGVNPQDVTFEQARSGGVTCVCTGPGSSNVILQLFR